VRGAILAGKINDFSDTCSGDVGAKPEPSRSPGRLIAAGLEPLRRAVPAFDLPRSGP
jgi:hypothetical protein